MARKTLQDLSGIAKTIADSAPGKDRPARAGAPALGALQGTLSAIREIDCDLIDDWGPKDRLDGFTAVNSDDDTDGLEALKDSISEAGQQVPILVRKSPKPGRFEVIYGRRRLRACRELGRKVRANVQEMDDATALLAKGLENAARRNLSFYEKARFAAVIRAAGHNGKTVQQVLGLTKSGVSHLSKVSENVPDEVGDAIGPAPKAGRPKWTALAEAFGAKKITSTAAQSYLKKHGADMTSDARLDALLSEIARRGARPRATHETTPVDGVTVKSSRSSIAVTIKRTGQGAAFANWLDAHIDDLIQDAHAQFTAVNALDET